MNCKCGKEIPEARFNLGFRDCVDCSTTEQVGCVDIVNHKTGNTIQIMDKASAKTISESGKRSNFGALTSMKKAAGSTGLSINVIIVEEEDPKRFEEAGRMALQMLDTRGMNATQAWLIRKVNDLWITQNQMDRITIILEECFIPKQVFIQKKENSVSSEINDAFKYWKR